MKTNKQAEVAPAQAGGLNDKLSGGEKATDSRT